MVERKRANGMDLTAAVVRGYFAELLTGAELKSAQQAVRSAESDLQRAESVRAAGMSTDADVLSIRVHLAAMRQQEIRRKYEIEVARATLNELLGAPIDAAHDLITPLEAGSAAQDKESSALEKTAVSERPETREARIQLQLAEHESAAARAALRPRVGLRFVIEADRQRFVDRGGANWLVSASFEWNLFNGFADRAHRAEAHEAVRAANAEARQADAAVRVAVHRAAADLNSANEQIAVAEAAVAMADESLRINKNRFDNGMTTVTELLRNETAVLDARTRRLEAVYQQRIAEVNLEYATGTLK
jgi:outer membrane protein